MRNIICDFSSKNTEPQRQTLVDLFCDFFSYWKCRWPKNKSKKSVRLKGYWMFCDAQRCMYLSEWPWSSCAKYDVVNVRLNWDDNNELCAWWNRQLNLRWNLIKVIPMKHHIDILANATSANQLHVISSLRWMTSTRLHSINSNEEQTKRIEFAVWFRMYATNGRQLRAKIMYHRIQSRNKMALKLSCIIVYILSHMNSKCSWNKTI